MLSRFDRFKWNFSENDNPTYMYDSRLSFGQSSRPRIFQNISEPVCKIMESVYNFICIPYLDDFLIIADTVCDCSRGLHLLINTLGL